MTASVIATAEALDCAQKQPITHDRTSLYGEMVPQSHPQSSLVVILVMMMIMMPHLTHLCFSYHNLFLLILLILMTLVLMRLYHYQLYWLMSEQEKTTNKHM